MLDLHTPTLARVVAQARQDAAAHPRWLVAISRAVRELESNPWIERDELHGGLLIGSPSGKCYAANGVCSCLAYQNNQPCWHRACARLVRRYDEAVARECAPPANWPRDFKTGKPMDWYKVKEATERPGYERALTDVCELFAS